VTNQCKKPKLKLTIPSKDLMFLKKPSKKRTTAQSLKRKEDDLIIWNNVVLIRVALRSQI
jgi:hypothetical protein